MLIRSFRPFRLTRTFVATAMLALMASGCGTFPFGASITATQQTDEPNFTVDFVLNGVNNSSVTSVNWLFGDGPGFTTGGTTISHRYSSGGTYTIKAYVFFTGGSTQTVNGTATVTVPNTATNPSPSNGATNVAVNVSFSWFPGNGATSSDVYLGTSSASVSAATQLSPEYQGNVTGTTFTPNGLQGGTVYFWRIDSVKSGTTTKGDIWSFTTALPPGQASDPSPTDGSTGNSVTTTLSWTAGGFTSSHNVYFGTDQNAVENATQSSAEFRGNQTTTTFNPGALTAATTYYWRIDEVGTGGTTKGAVWSFTTSPLPTQATNPDPADTATDEEVSTALSWTAGSDTTSHDFYFGTSQTVVNAATTSSPEFKGNQTATTTQPAGTGNLNANTTYFWRIDEVGPGGTTKGIVWSFVTASLPGQTTQPSPEIGQQGIDLSPTLTWSASSASGVGPTTSYDVYFGTSSSAVNSATKGSPEFKGNQAGTSFSPSGPLAENTQFFWRIDAVGPGGTTKGALFNFTTLNSLAASNPVPANQATDVPLAQVLAWAAGTCSGTLTHNIYLGTSQSAVTSATTASPEFQGNFPSLTFDPPGDLNSNTQYFWRIDEVCDSTTTKGVVWSFTTLVVPPGQISNPNPTDGATDVALNATLSWTAGSGATSHDRYFGTDQTAVQNATTASPEYKGNTPNPTYNPGALTASTTYYWRIDEKNSAGTTTGTVLSFTTVPAASAKATNPSPGDAATGQNVNTAGYSEIALSLSWTAGAGATSHDVYFGTNQTAVTNATTSTAGIFKGNQAGTTFDPGPLTAGTQYFWRIDEKNSGGTTKGDVWSFTTFTPAPGLITNPNPPNAGTVGSTSPTLTWTAASDTTFYDVYFGTSQVSVQNATRSSGEYIGAQPAADTDYATGTLTAATTYFWRIDAIGAGGVTKGVVRQFATP